MKTNKINAIKFCSTCNNHTNHKNDENGWKCIECQHYNLFLDKKFTSTYVKDTGFRR